MGRLRPRALWRQCVAQPFGALPMLVAEPASVLRSIALRKDARACPNGPPLHVAGATQTLGLGGAAARAITEALARSVRRSTGFVGVHVVATPANPFHVERPRVVRVVSLNGTGKAAPSASVGPRNPAVKNGLGHGLSSADLRRDVRVPSADLGAVGAAALLLPKIGRGSVDDLTAGQTGNGAAAPLSHT